MPRRPRRVSTSRRLTAVLLCALAVALAACETRSRREDGQRDVPSRVAIDSGQLALEHIVSIGVLDGPPEYAFGRIETVVPLDAEHFVACDVADAQVRRYSLSGEFTGSVGRKGSGPAEYESCNSMLLNRSGELVINDVGNGRLVFFDRSGSYVRAEEWPPLGVIAGIDSLGRVWSTEYRSGRGGDERSWNVVVLRDGNRRRIDSLVAPSLRLAPGLVVPGFGTDEGALSPRLGDTTWAVLPIGGLAVARTDEYRVTITRLDRTIVEISRDIRAVPYAPEERREWEAAIQRVRSAVPFGLPDEKPIVRQLRGDNSGRLWIRLADSAYRLEGSASRLTHREQGRWDIWDIASHRYLGELRLPRRRRIVAIAGDLVWLSGPGPDDEQRIEVYRLTSSPGW